MAMCFLKSRQTSLVQTKRGASVIVGNKTGYSGKAKGELMARLVDDRRSGGFDAVEVSLRAGEFVGERALQLSAMHHAHSFRDEKLVPRCFQIQ
ncbi:hypothetical protein [Rhizobium brockwellii]